MKPLGGDMFGWDFELGRFVALFGAKPTPQLMQQIVPGATNGHLVFGTGKTRSVDKKTAGRLCELRWSPCGGACDFLLLRKTAGQGQLHD
jgi:hypothetical protein